MRFLHHAIGGHFWQKWQNINRNWLSSNVTNNWYILCMFYRFRTFPHIWWRHQMETFSALLALCAGNSPITGEFPSQSPVTQSFDVFFDLLLNKRLSKQLIRRWFQTPSCSLLRHCNEFSTQRVDYITAVVKTKRRSCLSSRHKNHLILMITVSRDMTWFNPHKSETRSTKSGLALTK